MKSVRLTLYGRAWCHLCDDMLAGLETLRNEYGFSIDVVDVDADPALAHTYNERVPVLLVDGRELCHHFVGS